MKIALNTRVPATLALSEKLRPLGFVTCSLADLSTADLVILVNPNTFELKQAEGLKKQRRILVCLEPPSVLPLLYKRRVIEKFELVFVQAADYVSHPNQSVWQPGYFEADIEPTRRSSRNFAVSMVNANKTSFNPGSLYHLRESLALRISVDVNLNLYGRGWGQSLWASFLDALKELLFTGLRQQTIPQLSQFSIRNKWRLRNRWLGEVASARDAYAENHFALVVENDRGYFSEKLFNALQAGSVPIFVGQDPLADSQLEQCVLRVSGNLELFSPQALPLREIAARKVSWKRYRKQAFDIHNPEAGWQRLALGVQAFISDQELS